MSGIRGWVVRKLREDGTDGGAFELVGAHGLRVVRNTRPDALIYCAGVGNGTFMFQDLDRSLDELPDVQFVVVVPAHIDPPVHIRAAEIGLCVGGFAELGTALHEDDDVSRHQMREQVYVLRRLNAVRAVRSVRRTGLSSYEVERSHLPNLTIVTAEAYEITADEVYSLLEVYSGFDVDAVAVTNPNARGISSDASQAGAVAGVRMLPFDELLLTLGERWT